jgi:prepilin peptidase CpaA
LSDLILVAVLVVAAVTDLRTGRIYNWLVYPAVIVGLALGALVGGLAAGGFSGAGAWVGFKDHALAAAIGFGVLFFCYALGGMGGGDVKLMAVVGALGGLNRPDQDYFILYAMFYSFAVGAVLGIFTAIWKRVLGETAVRTWWGLRTMAMPGTTLDDATPKKPAIRVPFGFATAVGTTWLLAENFFHGSLWSLVGKLF